MAIFWAEMQQKQRATSNQRTLFLLDVMVMIYRCPQLFLKPSILRGVLDALIPSLLLQNSSLYQEIEVRMVNDDYQ